MLEYGARYTSNSETESDRPNLKTITIDTMYDLTLIVGTSEHDKVKWLSRSTKDHSGT
jgi:hypothetical protein